MKRLALTDLLPGRSYSVQVRSKGPSGTSDWSQSLDFTTVIDQVAPLVITGLQWTSAETSWLATWNSLNMDVEQNMDFAYYEVTVTSGSSSAIYNMTGTRFEFTLEQNIAAFGTPKNPLTISIRTVDFTGNKSSAVSVGPVSNPAPGSPTGLSTVPSVESIELSWLSPADLDIDGYRVYSSTTSGGTYSLSGFTKDQRFTHTTTSSSNLFFRVFTVDIFGTESTAFAQSVGVLPKSAIIADVIAPSVPAGLASVISTDTFGRASAALSWTAVADTDLSNYIVRYRRVGTTPYSQMNVDRNSTTAVISLPVPYVNYEFQISAIDFQGNQSAFSSTVTATGSTNAAPPTVVGLALTPGRESLTASWTESTADDVKNGAGLYLVEFATNSGFTTGLLTYRTGANSITVSGLSPATAYWARVKAIDSVGVLSAAYSTAVTATTGTYAGLPVSDGTPPASSPTPTVTGGIGFLNVSWSPVANNDPVTYEVHLSVTSGFTPAAGTKWGELNGTFAIIENLPQSTTALTYGTTYYVKIVAKDKDGSAAAGTQGSGTPVKVTSNDSTLTAGDVGAPTTTDFSNLTTKVNASVKVVVNEYSVNSSETVAPTTGWSTTQPARTPGTFVWYRTKVTYTDDTTSTTSAALLTGNTGSQGSQGIPGTPGSNGVSLYTWLKYADTPTTGMSDSPVGKTYIGLAYNKSSATESSNYGDYEWTLVKGEQGIPGAVGSDGITTYTWVKYADTVTGTGMNDSPAGKTYIGFAFNKTTATESTTASDYAWSLIQGPQGDTGSQGIQGPAGADGISRYTWIKYADTPTTGMNDLPTGKTYMGIAYNKTSATESSTYADYEWSLIKGTDGLDGKGISSTAVTYQTGSSGTAAPTGTWNANPTATTTGQFLWTRTITTYTDATTSTGYAVSAHGATGGTGATGKGISSTAVTYQVHTSGSAAPTGTWQTTVQATTTGQFLWTRTITTFTDATTVTAYAVSAHGATGSQGIQGPTGPNGQPTYTWIKYAPNATPTDAQINDLPDGMTHIGFAFNKTTATESSVATDYTFSLIQGPQGDTGDTGPAGSDGRGITGTTVTYQTGTSGTAEPTGTWNASPTVTTTGQFLWTRTVTTYTTGTPTTAYAVSAHGATGSTGSTGTAGRGVSNTVVTYQVGTSGSTAPTGTWLSTIPATTTGQFLWTRTITNYTDGLNPTTAYAVSAHGATGSTGSTGPTGTSVASVTPYFYQITTGSAAPALPTGGTPSAPWTATEPAYVANTELYRSDRIVFANPTSTSYTAVTKVSSYAAAVEAMLTANGKNTINHSTAAPTTSSVGKSGDIWFVRADNVSPVTAQYELTNSVSPYAWVQKTLSDTVIANLSAGKLIAGSTFTSNLIVKSTFTLGDSGTPGIIKSYDYNAGTGTGFSISSAGIDIQQGSINARALSTGTLTASTSIIVGTGALIKSANYVAGSSGFAITATGLDIPAGTVNANILSANSSFVTTLNIGSGGSIQSTGYTSGGTSGFSLSNTGLTIKGTNNVVDVATLTAGTITGKAWILGTGATMTVDSTASIKSNDYSGSFNASAGTGWALQNNTLVINSGSISAKAIKTSSLETATITLGTGGIIQSSDYNGGTAGFKLDSAGLVVRSGIIEAAALRIQQGFNIVLPEYADFEFRPSYYTSGAKFTVAAGGMFADAVSGGIFGSQSLGTLFGANSVDPIIYLGTSTTNYNIKIDASKKYIVSAYAWCLGTVATNVQLKIKWSNGTIAPVDSRNLPASMSISGAQRLTGLVTPPAGVTGAVLLVESTTRTVLAGFNLDGIQVEEQTGSLSTPSTWNPPSSTSIDGGSIRTGTISSTIYTPGSAGWAIGMDGSVEFNNATLRGTLQTGTIAGDLIMSGGSIKSSTTGNRFEITSVDTGVGVTPVTKAGINMIVTAPVLLASREVQSDWFNNADRVIELEPKIEYSGIGTISYYLMPWTPTTPARVMSVDYSGGAGWSWTVPATAVNICLDRVSNPGSNRVVVLDSVNFVRREGITGSVVNTYTAPLPVLGGSALPTDIAIDTTGAMYISLENKIYKYTSAGAATTNWAVGTTSEFALSVATDFSNNVYVLTGTSPKLSVKKYSSTGTLISTWQVNSTDMNPNISVFIMGSTTYFMVNDNVQIEIYNALTGVLYKTFSGAVPAISLDNQISDAAYDSVNDRFVVASRVYDSYMDARVHYYTLDGGVSAELQTATGKLTAVDATLRGTTTMDTINTTIIQNRSGRTGSNLLIRAKGDLRIDAFNTHIIGAGSWPAIQSWSYRTVATSTPSIPNTSNVNIPGLSITWNARAGDVVNLDTALDMSIGTAGTAVGELVVDGVAQGQQVVVAGAAGTRVTAAGVWRIAGLSEGPHTAYIRCRMAAAGTATAGAQSSFRITRLPATL